MKKFIVPVLLLLSIWTLVSFIPSIQRWNKLARLETLKAEVEKCQLDTIPNNHLEANKIREELGLVMAWQPQLSWKILEWTQTWLLKSQPIE